MTSQEPMLRLSAMMLALGVGLLASDGHSQPRSSARIQACGVEAAAERARCGGDVPCADRARLVERRCALACDTTMSPAARCREECDIDSDACDAACRDEPDDGARRGCLRRCGSRFHISCPRECDVEPPLPDARGS